MTLDALAIADASHMFCRYLAMYRQSPRVPINSEIRSIIKINVKLTTDSILDAHLRCILLHPVSYNTIIINDLGLLQLNKRPFCDSLALCKCPYYCFRLPDRKKIRGPKQMFWHVLQNKIYFLPI